MLFTICYTCLALSHWYRAYRQRCLVMNAIRAHGTRASIAFWKIGRVEVTEGASVLTRVSQLCDRLSSELVTEVLHEKRGKQMMMLHPKHCVDLSKEWTSFLGSHTPHQSLYDSLREQTPTGPPVFILIEASPPSKDHRGRPNVRKVRRENVIKLSSLTTPMAWRSGEPFGILVEANMDNFSMVGSAYLDGVLELDDGLLVDQIVTVDIKGKPFDILREQKKTTVADSTQPPIEGAPIRRVPSGGNLKATQIRTPSGGNISDSSSGSRAVPVNEHRPLRRKHSVEFMRRVETQQKKPVEEKPKIVDKPVALQNGHSVKDEVKPKEKPTVKVEAVDNTEHTLTNGATTTTNGCTTTTNGATNGMASINSDSAVPISHRKPPNVLIYTGPDDSDPSKFDSTKLALEQCLLTDRYVIYRLNHKQILTIPWVENCALVVIASGSKIRNAESDRFMQYLNSGGMLLSFGGAFAIMTTQHQGPASYQQVSEVMYKSSEMEQEMTLMALLSRGGIPCGTGKDVTMKTLAECQGQAVLAEVQIANCKGKAILSQVHLEMSSEEMLQDTAAFTELKKSSEFRRQVLMDVLSHLSLQCGASEVPQLTPAYLLGDSKKFLVALQPSLKDGTLPGRTVSLSFCSTASDIKDVTAEVLPVVTGETDGVTFDLTTYQANLETQVLGNLVLYAEVIPTTMTLFEGFLFKVPSDVGVVSIATRMSAGRGRGGNKWIAPAGCAMFSLHVRIPCGSELADKLPFLQHIASAAVVEAVRTMPGYEEIDLRLKWPNDIYFSDSIKLGGVIVNSSMMDQTFYAIIGCGFNVSNSDPTVCINDLVRLHNKQTGSNLALCTTEQLIARTVSIIEKIIQRFQRNGSESFLPIYYNRWLHGGARVRLESETGPEVTVMGLDECGFLAVKDTEGKIRSVQPDGNSFDMTKNLVLMKQR